MPGRPIPASSKLLQPDEWTKQNGYSKEDFDKIVENIGIAAGRKYVTIRDAFKDLDKDRSGQVAKPEIRRLFKSYGYSKEAADQFFDSVDVDGGGEISFGEFAKHFIPHIQPLVDAGFSDPTRGVKISGEPTSQVVGSLTSKIGLEPDTLLGKERVSPKELEKIVENINQAVGLKYVTVRNAFNQIDKDRSGQLCKEEVQRLFSNYGYAAAVADQFFETIDIDDSGEINLQEFKRHFAPHVEFMDMEAPEGFEPGDEYALVGPSTTWKPAVGMDERQLTDNEINEAIKTIGNAASGKYVTVRDAFQSIDKNRNGFISRNELRQLFNNYGYDDSAADSFLSKIDTDGSNKIDFPEFRKYFKQHIEPVADVGQYSHGGRHRKVGGSPTSQIHGSISANINDSLASDKKLSDEDLAEAVKRISQAAGRKYCTLRGAFQSVDRDRGGTVSRNEVRDFFENYGYGPVTADQFFTSIDVDGSGSLEFNEFAQHFVDHVEPGRLLKPDPSIKKKKWERCPQWQVLRKGTDGAKDAPVGTPGRESMRRSASEPAKKERRKKKSEKSLNAAAKDSEIGQPPSESRYEEIQQPEVCAALGNISRRAEAKYGSLRQALQRVTDNVGQSVTRRDAKKLFRRYGHAGMADKFFDHVDRNGRGEVDFTNFQEHFSKNVEDALAMDFKRGSSRNGDADAYETTYMSSYTPSSCGSSVR